MGSVLAAGGPVVAVFCPDDTTPSEELLGRDGVCSGGGTDARIWLASSGHVSVVRGLSKRMASEVDDHEQAGVA